MTTIYQSSSGPKVIADMNPHNLFAAHAKLVRDRIDESRDEEIAALAERIAVVEAEYEAEAATLPGAA
jgi:hypothetical protein